MACVCVVSARATHTLRLAIGMAAAKSCRLVNRLTLPRNINLSTYGASRTLTRFVLRDCRAHQACACVHRRAAQLLWTKTSMCKQWNMIDALLLMHNKYVRESINRLNYYYCYCCRSTTSCLSMMATRHIGTGHTLRFVANEVFLAPAKNGNTIFNLRLCAVRLCTCDMRLTALPTHPHTHTHPLGGTYVSDIAIITTSYTFPKLNPGNVRVCVLAEWHSRSHINRS